MLNRHALSEEALVRSLAQYNKCLVCQYIYNFMGLASMRAGNAFDGGVQMLQSEMLHVNQVRSQLHLKL
jgi:hypothetical protein